MINIEDLFAKLTPEQQAELVVAYTGRERPRYRRGSDFRTPPLLVTDRNLIAKLWWLARAHEARTKGERRQAAQAAKKPGRRAKPIHGGDIGKAGLEIFRLLLFVVPKLRGLYPTLAKLGELGNMHPNTVVAAIKRLVRSRFVTAYRRIKRLAGGRLVQDSNCYAYHPPTGLDLLGWSDHKSSAEARTADTSKRLSEAERATRRAKLEAGLAERARRWSTRENETG